MRIARRDGSLTSRTGGARSAVTVHVLSATNRLIPLLGTVRVRATAVDGAKTFVIAQIADLQKTLDIGDPVAVSTLIDRIMNAPGVVNVGLVDTTGNPLVPIIDDFVLGKTEVATFSDGLTWVPL